MHAVAHHDARAGAGRWNARRLPLRASLTAAVLVALAGLMGLASFGAGFAAPAAAYAAEKAARPPITVKLIPFGATRKAQTATYNQRHYHQHTWKLTDPKVVVLHHTSGADWESAWWTFANNTAYASGPKPEKPGVSAHFIVDKDGTIYQCLPLTVRGRHAIGMNWTSFGIEFVQEDASGKDGRWMDRQILNRRKQIDSGLKLVRYLLDRFGMKNANVVGHATANDSPYFKDYTGIKNGAGDWFAPEVKAFRARL
jgi:N-acetylmuramoyl-L-alanine amidase